MQKPEMRHTKLEYNKFYFSERLKRKMKLLAFSGAAVLEAPSGYGKTTAMRGYVKDLTSDDNDDHDVFWFTAIDEESPTVLYRRFCRDIGRIDSNVSQRLLDIDFPNTFTIGEVCDTLRSIQCEKKTWFIIDDFHYLFAILPASFLIALLNSGKEDLRVIIITQMLGQDFQKNIISRGIPYITASDLQWDPKDIRNYFMLSGEEISMTEANEVERITNGWIIAVHLQLCSYLETRTFSDEAVLQMMEHMIWNKMTPEQQMFFMRMSPFESCTVMRLCAVSGFDAMPDFAADTLSNPFIRYIHDQKLCVPHKLLRDMVCIKRREQGEDFERECFRKAGDVCRDDGELAEAVFFYSQINDYERILSLDLSGLICVEVGTGSFNDIALEITQNCPSEIKKKYPHSMLCAAWAVRFSENKDEFMKIMGELNLILPENGILRAEWLLLSVYILYPKLDEMLPVVQKAAEMFAGKCSAVILPQTPWAFYEYLQISTFHVEVGSADEEADLLEKFIKIYSQLTGGHGTGADVLFRAELAFFRCDTAQAEIYAHQAVFLSGSKHQKNIQIGAIRLLAVIALFKSDLSIWQRMVNDVEQAAFGSMQNTSIYRKMLDIIYGSLMAQLREYDSIADWLKKPDFLSEQLPSAIYIKAIEIHGYYLMGKGEYAQLIGFLQSAPQDEYTPFSDHFRLFTTAVGYSSLGDISKANELIEASADKSLPDEMLHCFAGFSRLLDGLSDKLLENSYPQFMIRFEEYKNRYFTGWFALHNAIAQNELPNALTEREREIAELAAEGLRNIEIANKLYLSEHTVRAHLRSIYQKLDIDRRAKLTKALK